MRLSTLGPIGALLLGGIGAMTAGAWRQTPTPTPAANGRPADRAAIVQTSREFATAFEKGDAAAVAALWTDQAEYQNDAGLTIRGRANLEKAFAQLFKDNGAGKMEVHIDSIRFVSRDCAVEEGLLRQQTSDKALPDSTEYSTIHVREDGKWKIAFSREWGAGQHRLADLDWLIGSWNGKAGPQEIAITFSTNANKPGIDGTFTLKADGKVTTAGSMKINIDPQRGQIRSWNFDDDGGHGQSLWVRDGNRWVMDCVGVTADGIDTHSLNLLSRVGKNEIVWQSIDRILGQQSMPDTPPIKLIRTTEGK